MSKAKSICIYCYASSPDAAAWMLKFVFVYLANTAVVCYSLTIICCCQVQDYINWIISTENDLRHHHKFIKYEKRLRKEGKNMFGLPFKQNICKFSASLDAYKDGRRNYYTSLPFCTNITCMYSRPGFGSIYSLTCPLIDIHTSVQYTAGWDW